MYGNCSAADHKALQRVVKTAQQITGTQLPTIEEIYHKRCLGRARNIIKDASYPNHRLFTLLPCGRHYRSLCSRNRSLRKSFFPMAVTLLNSTPPFSTLYTHTALYNSLQFSSIHFLIYSHSVLYCILFSAVHIVSYRLIYAIVLTFHFSVYNTILLYFLYCC